MSPDDQLAVARQLGREPRDVIGVAHRCPCGAPDVVATAPRLSDGSPFPTLYYLTCPRAASAIGGLEGTGVMRDMEDRLIADPDVADAYRRAHDAYLADRDAFAVVPEIAGVSAGGMPDRVKCLHVLLAHALAAGPGVNVFGDEVVSILGSWWDGNSCSGHQGVAERVDVTEELS